MSVEKMRKNRKYFCLATEDRTHHIHDFHINVNEETLKNRHICREAGDRKVKSSTSFYKEMSAEKYIEATLFDEENLIYIAEWLKDYSEDILVIEKEFIEQVGYGFKNSKSHNWKEGALPAYRVRVVIAKNNKDNALFPFCIKTAYPII